MLKVENIHVDGFEAAIRGMRNPMNSWDKSDSGVINNQYVVGPEDIKLMHKLYSAGPEHAKYLRMIHVSIDVTAPLYWWKEADQYKIATTTNSCSTMHKIHSKELTIDDFSHEHLSPNSEKVLLHTIKCMNDYREEYLKDREKHNWWQMIQLLPSSYNQKRTWDFDYQTAINMIRQRDVHKLDEWHVLVNALYTLPYLNEIMEGDAL